MLSENPFSLMSKSQLRSLIESRYEGQPLGKFFKENPKFFSILVDVIRDARALPKFLSILNQPEKLKAFGIFVLSVLIASSLIGLFYARGNMFKRLLLKISLMFGSIILNLLGFVFIFRSELVPTYKIIIGSF